MNSLNKGPGRCPAWGGRLLAMALAGLLLALPVAARAQGQETLEVIGKVTVSGLTDPAADPPNGEQDNLTVAVDKVNAHVGHTDTLSGSQKPIFTFGGNQKVPDSPTSTEHWWSINGNGAKAMDNLTVKGENHAINGPGTPANSLTPGAGGVLLAIENVAGNINVENLGIANGRSSNAYTGQDSISGGGLFVGRQRANGNAAFNALNLTTVTFTGNEVSLTSNLARGGALSVVNIDAGGDSRGSANLNGVNFIRNAADMNGTGSAVGGGGSILGVKTITYENGAVVLNRAHTLNGDQALGGGLALEGKAFSANLINITFDFNIAMINSTNPDAVARGGAFYAQSETNSSVNFSGTTEFTYNLVLALNSVMGGAAAFLGSVEGHFSGTRFESNEAIGLKAYGGAVASAEYSGVQAQSLTFDNVVAKANQALANATNGTAYGGAVYAQGAVSVIDSSFEENEASGRNAFGGAFYMDTKQGPAASLSLSASADHELLISGNTANGRSSGVYFGASDNSNSAVNALLEVAGAGHVKMLDALGVNVNNNRSFTLAKSGAGTFTWGSGGNEITRADGGATIQLDEGTTVLNRDFALAVKNSTALALNSSLGAGGTALNFDSRRLQNQAMFNLQNSSTFSSNVAGGTTMAFSDERRQLLDFEATYTVVSGLANADAVALATAYNTGFTFDGTLAGSVFGVDGNDNLVLTVNYDSPFKAALRAAGANTLSAAGQLDRVLDLDAVSDAEVDLIHSSLNTVTSEYGPAAARMGLNVTRMVAIQALRDLKREQNHSLPGPLYQSSQPAYGGPSDGPRLWGGFIGNFSSVDSAGGYHGYDQNSSGGLIGLSYDNGPTSGFGLYAALTRNKQKYGPAVKNDSNAIQAGLVGRFSPIYDVDPNVSVYGDVGYAIHDNDGKRYVGGREISANFDQRIVTVGAGVEYLAAVTNDVRLTPSLDLRYTHLFQDSYWEQGYVTLLNRVNSVKADSFTSLLALSASTEIQVTGGTLTPMVRLGWQHEYGDRNYETTGRYTILGGNAPRFRLSTVEADSDALDVGLGMRAMLESGAYNQVGLNVSYDLSVSENATDQSLYGGLEYRF